MNNTKTTVFLSGPIFGLQTLNYNEFKLAEERINALGYKTIIPHDLFDEIDMTEVNQQIYKRVCVKHMMDANVVVTLQDWEQCPFSKNQVLVAREMEIPVQHIITFLNGKSN